MIMHIIATLGSGTFTPPVQPPPVQPPPGSTTAVTYNGEAVTYNNQAVTYTP